MFRHTPQRIGISRFMNAIKYSMDGIQCAWQQAAFRQECYVSIVLVPASFWVGRNWLEIAFLIFLSVMLLILELLNTCVEAAIDRVGHEWHALSKAAKDIGSAAVALWMIFVICVWLIALYSKWTL